MLVIQSRFDFVNPNNYNPLASPKFNYKGYTYICNMSEKRKLSESTESSKRSKQPIDQLALIKETSIFVGTTFHEAVDKEKFIRLMHSRQLQTQMPSDATGKWVEMKQSLGLENEFKQFFKLYKNIYGDAIQVRYNASKHGWGRVSPGGGLSLGLVRCEPRHTVAKDLYVDIDMKNCFPSILHQLCIRHKIECSKLSNYVEQQEEWLERLQNTHHNTEKVDERGTVQPCKESISRNDAKKLMLEILHGKSYSTWKKGVIKKKDGKWVNPVTGEENARFNPKMGDDEETLAYEKEIKQITKVIKDANPEMYQEVTKYKAYNEDGTFMSIFLQEWERRLLEHAYTFLKEKGVIDGDLNHCVLCFDGIMVLKKN